MTITIRHLEQIEALTRFNSFAKAARHLHISQPALSRSISVLENQLGVKIFDRLPGNLLLTVFGQRILQKGNLILQDVRVLHRDLDLLREIQTGEINIGCGPFTAETFIGEALAAFHVTHPNINVQVTVDMTPQLLPLLKGRTLDLFVAETRDILTVQDLDITPLNQQQGHFCCRTGHPLSSKQTLTVREILNFPMAVMWLPDAFISLLNKTSGMSLSNMSDFPHGVIQCNNFKILFDIISSTDAIGITSQRVLDKTFHKNTITLLKQTLIDFQTHYGIVKNNRCSQPPAVDLLELNIIEAAEKESGL